MTLCIIDEIVVLTVIVTQFSPKTTDLSLNRGLPTAATDVTEVVSGTAAKLALQSAESHMNTKNGRNLMRFSERMNKRLTQRKNRPRSAVTSAVSVSSASHSDVDQIFDNLTQLEEANLIMDANSGANSGIRSGQVRSDFVESMDSPVSKSEPQSNKIEALDWTKLMVEIRSLSFSYDRKKKFIDKLNMSVPKSAIYGLLGPSGCGKTTLLRLILGLIKPKMGLVKVNGKPPGDPANKIPGIGVGFMPQELALFQEITLNEALKYFSKLYGMSDELTLSRIKFLVDFLDLPDADRLIGTMSGGQKRRVSLSLSLVHNPPILILDEPTVGTDPVLRERIWEHLVVLSQTESTTIIITTHYIEEARRAHVISLMREGKLLVEHSPQHLLTHFCVQNLEEVFLKMCEDKGVQNMPQNYNDSIAIYSSNKADNAFEKPNGKLNGNEVKVRGKGSVSSYKRVMTQTHKNGIRLMRNKPLLIFETILPTICIIIFCLCIGTKPYNIQIAIYNGEYVDNNTFSLFPTLSQLFISQKHYTSNESAINAVRDTGEIFGALIFNQNFTTGLYKRFTNKFNATDDDIDYSTIQFFGDFTDMIITETLTKTLIDAEYDFMRETMNRYMVVNQDPQMRRQVRVFDPIIKMMDPIYGSLDPNFRDFMAPGIIISVIYFMAVGLTALTLVVERKEGLMERSLVAGLKMHEILASQVILQFFIVTLQATLLMIFTFLVFEVPNNGNMLLVIVIVLMQGVGGMCFGLVISSVCNEENSAIMASLGSFYSYFLISGVIWPLEGMPPVIRNISYFLPQTLSIIALRNVMLKGWSLTYQYVYLGFVSIFLRKMYLKVNAEDTDQKNSFRCQSIESLDWTQLMVKIRSLVFTYDKRSKFIDKLDMSVPKGAIYGLLGPSGCGKTSLLKLILGLLKPKSGKIKINGTKPSDPSNNIPGIGVGFMPQELALFHEITLHEALKYYCRLYGMSRELTLLRIDFLVNLFDLPNVHHLIKDLSCGEKRRISLCIALVHNPPFLILDEPTVGTDPLLKEKIWDHLVELSQTESTTIIITTHYIEEARRAHVISLMRKGKLLVEQSPQYLLDYFCVQNLEEVFLRMCLNYKLENMPQNYLEILNNNYNSNNAFITNEVNLLALLFQVILPTLIIVLKHYSSKSRALSAINEEDLFGALIIDKGFTTGFMNRYAFTNNVTDKDLFTSTIQFYGDFSDLIIMKTLMRVLMEAERDFMRESVHKYITNGQRDGKQVRMFDPFVRFMDPPIYGSLDPNFRDFVATGVIVSLIYFMAVGLTALTMGTERKSGLLDRSLVAGLRLHEILASQIILQFLIVILQSVLVMVFSLYVFELPHNGSVVYSMLIVVLQGIGGMFFGLVISAVSQEENSSIMLALGSINAYFLMSGIIWPLEGMSPTMRSISYLMPQTLSIQSLRDIMFNGWSLDTKFSSSDEDVKKDQNNEFKTKLSQSSPDPIDDKIDSLDWTQLMVKVRSLVYTYDKKIKFINNLNMSVPKGAIYGLLGPSGCGKTTLLRIILGLIKPKSGKIKINGRKPSDPLNNIPGIGIGFMPQELALFQEITLLEALRYFSRLYGLREELILQRIDFLVNFLNLPDFDRRIEKMSGGQKRRVSLALSLIHNPPLLILDEPTVGTDPLIRERIWEHLVELSERESTTIIITTHYIEEARRAHVISLMRKGRLLVEHSPQHLLNHFYAKNLEKVFLNMCQNLDENMPQNYIETKANNNHNNYNNSYVTKAKLQLNDEEFRPKSRVNSCQRVITQTHKNGIILMRNIPRLLFQIMLPAICVTIFCLCLGTKPYGIQIALYNGEHDESIVRNKTFISLNHIDHKEIEFVYFKSEEEAIDAVSNDDDIRGAFIIDKDFTTSMMRRFTTDLSFKDIDIKRSTIHFYGDFTDMIITQSLIKDLKEVEAKFVKTIISKYMPMNENLVKKLQTKILEPLVQYMDPAVYGSIDAKFQDYLAPGVIISNIFFITVGMTALTLVLERNSGLLERSLLTGLKMHEIIASQLILQSFVIACQTILLMLFLFYVFELSNNGNILYTLLMIILQGIAGMSFGLVISSVVSDEHASIMATLSTFYIYFFISGSIWPLEGMPSMIRTISYDLIHKVKVKILAALLGVALANPAIRSWGGLGWGGDNWNNGWSNGWGNNGWAGRGWAGNSWGNNGLYGNNWGLNSWGNGYGNGWGRSLGYGVRSSPSWNGWNGYNGYAGKSVVLSTGLGGGLGWGRGLGIGGGLGWGRGLGWNGGLRSGYGWNGGLSAGWGWK
ncbi:unnamed protein product [Medioppia subpectinata]|uniref:Uncharacterized protein n=1 Tax=Medioppia subpectinata TaxID=1979941 RepID=A0A7R9KCF9_9ACAR|nr:unnamed protein product [Medioppia subpectinata]CAG2100651.1 unnamed protein product [Medioppia subpectinata]